VSSVYSVGSSGYRSGQNVCSNSCLEEWIFSMRSQSRMRFVLSLLFVEHRKLLQRYIDFYLVCFALDTWNLRLAEIHSASGQKHISEHYLNISEWCRGFAEEIALMRGLVEASLWEENELLVRFFLYAGKDRFQLELGAMFHQNCSKIMHREIRNMQKLEEKSRVVVPQKGWAHMEMRLCLSRLHKICVVELVHVQLCNLALQEYIWWYRNYSGSSKNCHCLLRSWVGLFEKLSELSQNRLNSFIPMVEQCANTLSEIEAEGRGGAFGFREKS